MAAQTRWLLGGLAILGAVFKLTDLLIRQYLLYIGTERLSMDDGIKEPELLDDHYRLVDMREVNCEGHVRDSELRLQKEITEVEARLRERMRENKARLQKDIKDVELQIKQYA